jgi:hypothetical protein
VPTLEDLMMESLHSKGGLWSYLEICPFFGVVMHPDLGEAWKVGSLKALGAC